MQSFEEEKEDIAIIEDVEPTVNHRHHSSRRHNSQYGSCSAEHVRDDIRVHSTPVAESHSAEKGRWPLSFPTVSSWWYSESTSTSFLPDCSSRSQIGSDVDDSHRYSNHSHYKHDPAAQKMMNESEYSWRGGALQNDNGKAASISSRLWNELKKQAEKLADTDMQLAGLI